MSINVVHTLPEDQWRNFVENHPAGNIFHAPEMFQVFSRTKGHRPEIWAATKNRRMLALFLPVQITLMDGFLRSFTTRSVAYGSVLCVQDEEGKRALALLLQTYTHEIDGPPLFTELRNLSSLDEIQPILREYGFLYEDYFDYLVDLRHPPEEIFQGMGRRTRKNVRRELRRGTVTVEEVKEREQISACYELIRKSLKLAHVPPADPSLFEAAFDVLCPKGMARFTLARVGETPVVSSVELLYKDVIYGWYGGIDRGYSSHAANDLLTWQILRWGAENGYRLYDFGGAGKPGEEYAVRDFKAKFGGTLVCYGRNTYVHSHKLLWLSKQGYRLLRRWL